MPKNECPVLQHSVVTLMIASLYKGVRFSTGKTKRLVFRSESDSETSQNWNSGTAAQKQKTSSSLLILGMQNRRIGKYGFAVRLAARHRQKEASNKTVLIGNTCHPHTWEFSSPNVQLCWNCRRRKWETPFSGSVEDYRFYVYGTIV